MAARQREREGIAQARPRARGSSWKPKINGNLNFSIERLGCRHLKFGGGAAATLEN